MSYLRRGIVWLLEGLVLVVVINAVLAGVLLWRLSSAPVELDFLTPYLKRSFEASWENSRVEIGRTELRWEDLSELVELSVQDVELLDLTGNVAFALPEVELQLSLSALLRGVVAPTSIELSQARLVVQRSKEGELTVAQKRDNPHYRPIETQDASLALGPWLDQLTADPDPAQPFSYLTRLRILDSEITFIDGVTSQVVVFPLWDADLKRGRSGLSGAVDFSVGAGTYAPLVETDILVRAPDRMIDLSLEVKGLSPPAFAPWLGEAVASERLNLLLDGRLETSLSYDGELGPARLTLDSGPGDILLPDSSLEQLALRAFNLDAAYDPGANQVTITRAGLALGDEAEPGPTLSFAGTLQGSEAWLGGERRLVGDFSLDRLDVRQMPRYWPREVAPDPRPWILENIERGVAADLSLHIALDMPAADPSAVVLEELAGSFRIIGARVHYLRPLPAVEDIAASVIFDADTISFTVDEARLGALEVEDGTLIISALSSADPAAGIHEEIYLDLGVRAPVFDALSLLDHPRLDLIGGLGLSPAGSGGDVGARLVFRFPLLADLAFEDMEIGANASLKNLSVPNFLDSADISNGDVDLALNSDAMRVTGTVGWGGTKMQIDWKESFAANPDFRTTVKASVPSIDGTGLGALGADLAPYLEGPVAATAVLALRPDGQGELKIAANLQQAALAVPEIDWRKGPGREASVTLALGMVKGRLTGFRDLVLKAGDLRVRGAGQFAEQGALARLDLADLAFRDQVIDRTAILFEPAQTVIEIDGGDINAAEFVYDEDAGAADQQARAARDATERPAFTLRAGNLRRLRFGAERWLADARLALVQRADGWHQISVEAKVPRHLESKADEEGNEGESGIQREGVIDDSQTGTAETSGTSETTAQGPAWNPRKVSMDFRPAPGDGHVFTMRSDDIGGVLRAMDLIDTVQGGELAVNGTSPGPLPYQPLSARVELKDFVMVKAPLMARLLTVASLTGPLDLMRGRGISFARMKGNFTLLDGVANTDLFRIYGASLGLTAKGSVDFNRDDSDLVGTVVPAYAVNQVIGEIPLLGPLLTGGEGEGFLAVTYKMTGPLADPEIDVNALSALAPGFLRGLFIGDDSPEGAPSKALPDFPTGRQTED